MAVEIFSSNLSIFTGTVENPALRDSLNYLRILLGQAFVIREWDEGRIAVPVELAIDLPSLGNYNNIDIRPVEPILFVFSLTNYPVTCPVVIADRTDFPKDKLAHLYIAKNGRPPAFCFVRGNNDEWYANKRINDLLTRICNWLRDAAAGMLTQDGGQFEPLRLEAYSGTIIYDYDLLAAIVRDNKSFFPDENYALALFERGKDEDALNYKMVKILSAANVTAVIEDFDKEKKKDLNAPDKKLYHYGYILWSIDNQTYSGYTIDFPTNWEEFKAFCQQHNVDLEKFENTIATIDMNTFLNFPVIVGLKRPSNLIGYSSNIEFVNFRFRVDTADVSEGKISTNIPIKYQLHNQPLTQTLARNISGTPSPFPFRSVIFGCGALGSKIIMHLARAGQTDFTLIDPDHFSPHNLVRHALMSEDEGANKAFALKERITKMYPYETLGVVSAPSFKDGFFEKPDTFKIYQWIFDFTASEAFFNRLASAQNMAASHVCSASISDFGKLGIMYKEGAARNPRIDDLQAILYSQYKTNVKIREWLRRESQTNDSLIVQVGVGCNSETTVLSDDKVSLHSSYFCGIIKNEIDKLNDLGKIMLNRISEEGEYLIESESIHVEPFDIVTAANDPSWEVRFRKGILAHMRTVTNKAKENETGGVFVGVANYKTKTIHVVDLVPAPPDSKANGVCFYRGYHGLPEIIKTVTEGSGGQLGYVGEWHSHPHGPNGMSTVDFGTVQKFKIEFSKLTTPLPVFLTIVAPDKTICFVY